MSSKFCTIGRLTKDPVLKTLEDGTKVTNITIASDREYKGKDGKKITDFLNYTLWDKNAENICNISKQGSIICLEGYNTSEQIETENGKIYVQKPVVRKYSHLALAKETNYDKTEENTKEQEMEK